MSFTLKFSAATTEMLLANINRRKSIINANNVHAHVHTVM